MLPCRVSIASTKVEILTEWPNTRDPYSIRPSFQRSQQSQLTLWSEEVHASVFTSLFMSGAQNLESVEPPCSIEDIPEIDAVVMSVGMVFFDLHTTHTLSLPISSTITTISKHSSTSNFYFCKLACFSITVSINTLFESYFNDQIGRAHV